MVGCSQQESAVGNISLGADYEPICFRDLTPQTNPMCPEGFALEVDYQDNIDYCCEGNIAIPNESGEGKKGGKGLCVLMATDSCPFPYDFSPGLSGSDCQLSGCAAAGYDINPFTGDCTCACTETLVPAESTVTELPTCPEIPGLMLPEYDIDGGQGHTDACVYQDRDPAVTQPEIRNVTCPGGQLQSQIGQDVCVVSALCPDGTIPRPDGTCGTCSDGCIVVDHSTDIEPMHVLFVLDKSVSMGDVFDNTTKWDAATQSINRVLSSGGPFNYGLELFPTPGAECVADEIAVPTGAWTSGQIIETMGATRPDGNSTPLVDALNTAYRKGFSGVPRDAQKAVILISDGGDSCSGNPDEAVPLAARAYNEKNILTFTISLRAQQVDNDFLTAIADAGGTGKVIRSWTDEDVAEDIQSSIDTTACGFALTDSQAANTTDIEVTIDGQVIPFTDWRIVGNQVVIENAFCDAIVNGEVESVVVSANCS